MNEPQKQELSGRIFYRKISANRMIRVPAPYRSILDDYRFVINRGFKLCLTLYDWKNWNEQAESIRQLDEKKREVRDFQRYFYRAATALAADKKGNIRIPKGLIEWARIEKDIVLVICPLYMEIWASDIYDQEVKKQDIKSVFYKNIKE